MDFPDNLIETISSGNCVLFLGAGAAREAGAPVGNELATLLADRFEKHDISTHNLREFVDVLETTSGVDRQEIDKAIVETLQKTSPSNAHLFLPGFVWQAIFTTNYDRLIEIAYDIYRTSRGEPPLQRCNVVNGLQDQVRLDNRSSVNLYKLHGCISSIGQGNPLVLSSRDYRNTRKKRQRMLRTLKMLAVEHSILFIGYSFADQYLSELLDDIQQESPYHHHRTMFLVIPELTASYEEYFQSRNFKHLSGTFGQFCESLSELVETEARKKALTSRISSVQTVGDRSASIPTSLRVSLDSQLEIFRPEGSFNRNPKRFLSGFPPSLDDLKSRNDVTRDQQFELTESVRKALRTEAYLRPIVMVLGAGGAGKSTLAARVAYDIADQRLAISCRLKNPEQWNIDEIVNFADRIQAPVLFVFDGIEVRSWLRATKDLRQALTVARVNATLLLSCQKAVWNECKAKMGSQDIEVFDLQDRLSEIEAASLIEKLTEAKLLTTDAKIRQREVSNIVNECDGHLVAALLQIVQSGKFKAIVLGEYGNLSHRAQKAYQFVALLHQHRISIPDYLLNSVSTNNWDIFVDQVIREESELVIIQDLDATSGRLRFRSRHPLIARTIIDATVPKFEDRVRMYRRIFAELAASAEDRSFVLTLLTTESVRREIREEQYLEEFFDRALDLFPDDRALILQFGRHENNAGNYERAREILEWGKSINPRDSHILHQLGVCAQRRARRVKEKIDPLLHDSLIQEARYYFRQVQEIDPISQYGYVSEARLAINLARNEKDQVQKFALISEAESIIRSGLLLVREDDHDILRGCEAELSDVAGDTSEVLHRLCALDEKETLGYGSLYHLWAACLVRVGNVDEAIEVIKRGVKDFPGDEMLIQLMLQILEGFLFRARSRDVASEFIGYLQRETENMNIWIVFLKGVVELYDTQYRLAMESFMEVRRRMNSRASTRIRDYLRDESGHEIQKRGIIEIGRYGRPWIKDVGTGIKMPVDNSQFWERSGKPRDCVFLMGLSLMGPRASIIEKYQNG